MWPHTKPISRDTHSPDSNAGLGNLVSPYDKVSPGHWVRRLALSFDAMQEPVLAFPQCCLLPRHGRRNYSRYRGCLFVHDTLRCHRVSNQLAGTRRLRHECAFFRCSDLCSLLPSRIGCRGKLQRVAMVLLAVADSARRSFIFSFELQVLIHFVHSKHNIGSTAYSPVLDTSGLPKTLYIT